MINHKGTKKLTTQRLVLRRFTPEDAQAMFDNWANDERVTRFLTWTPHGSPELTKQLVSLWCDSYSKEDYYNWAIELDGRLIGNISVVRMNDRSECADLGYCMAYDCWNKGIMTEAAGAVVDFLFGEVGVNRIGIGHAVKNPGSGRVAQKCGFAFEGTKRAVFKAINGDFLDISEYGMLRSDWLEAREKKLVKTS